MYNSTNQYLLEEQLLFSNLSNIPRQRFSTLDVSDRRKILKKAERISIQIKEIGMSEKRTRIKRNKKETLNKRGKSNISAKNISTIYIVALEYLLRNSYTTCKQLHNYDNNEDVNEGL